MQKNEKFSDKAFSALQELAKQSPDFEQARMLVGAADAEASLKRKTIRKTIDTEWISRVEDALPALDLIIRTPSVAIEDQEQIVPVELTRRISEKSIKHLAQHTNLIMQVDGEEITPSRILNVFHEETYLTYENKFVNTLLVRLAAFIEKRFRALVGGSGIEQCYEFDYGVDFEHFGDEEKRTQAKVALHIELTSPLDDAQTQSDADLNAQFSSAIERIRRINTAVATYLSSVFVQKLGKNYIRPPVIRTNGILKNKNLKECLLLWEYIEGYEKTGFSVLGEDFAEMPSDEYISELYSSMALQYTQFYHGVIGQDAKLLAEKRLFETFPDFTPDLTEEELEDYLVYDSEYKKTVPVSRLMNNRKKLSEDERRVRDAIVVALRADDVLNAEILKAEEEKRRLERERLAAEEAERQRLAALREAALRGPIEIRYKRSFLSRYIQCGEELQGYYGVIKNELLSYARVKARTSWKCETYKQGRVMLSRINVMGKSLYLYLALDPAEYAGKNHVSDAGKKNADTPLLVKVKSERSLKRAIALIAEMMQKAGIARIEREPEDFTMPYESTEALLERGLVKMILPAGVTLSEYDETIRADIPQFIGDRKERPEEQIEAVQVEEAPAEISVELANKQIEVRYRRSFLSRYIQCGEELQGYYGVIKNELLSYARVKARTSWKCETYKQGRVMLSRINVMGKSLYLYLALDPAEYAGKNHVSDAGKKNADTPLLVKVKSERSLKRAIALIAEMMQKAGIARIEREPEDFTMPYESTEALLERGLVKMILPAGVTLSEYDETIRADIPQFIGERKERPEEQIEAVQVEEAPAEISVELANKQIEVRYRRSFLSRYIQCGEELQGYYGVIKNELLSYARVKARTSWKCETYKQGRTMLSRINVMGKSLYLYLALDPADYAGKNHVSDAGKKNADTPLLVKVKSERSLKRAIALIAEMMQKAGIARIEREPEDFTMPYESTEALLERGLVKMILPAGVTLSEYDETVRADIPQFIGERKEQETAEKAVEAPVEEPTVEVVAEAPVSQVEVRYRRSFLSRYIQCGEELQGYYGVIKNELLSYARVKARTSWKCETYKQGRVMLSRINVMGKSLYLYLALDPAEYAGKNHVSDAGKKNADTPLLVKVKSERSLKRAIALIAEMMQKLSIARIEREPEDFTMPYESTEALLERGLVKMILPAGVTLSEYDETVRADISTLLSGADDVFEEAELPEKELAAVSESEALSLTVQESADEETLEAATEIEAEEQEDRDTTAEAQKEPETGAESETGALPQQVVEVPERAVGSVVDLTQIDFRYAEFTHKVTPAMIEKFGLMLEAVFVQEKHMVAGTHYQLAMHKISKARRKRFRVRAKNLIFTDSAETDGLLVPYTKAEYRALSSKKKKALLQDAQSVWEYRRTCAQLALVRVLKSDSKKIIRILKELEEQREMQAESLPLSSIWQDLIKD